jgi:dethiobiotin synthetase
MNRAVYVTGTDTGAGKTLVSCTLVHALRRRGCSVAAMKPLASGAEPGDGGELRNADVEALLACCAPGLARQLVNPYCFAEPAAPEIAAGRAGVAVRLDPILSALDALAASHQHVVVEGVGGWEAPLSADLLQADLCRARALPVLLVVGLRLGCINHARLSLRAIADDGLDCLGWIGTAVDPDFAHADENLRILARDLRVPLLGVLPHARDPEPASLAHLIDTAPLD